MMHRVYLSLIFLLVLASCQSTPRIDAPVNPEWAQRQQVLQQIERWEFTGSINVRDAEEAHTSRIRWQQDKERYRINLWGTFNIGATEINGQPGYVRIEQQGEDPVITDSPEELLYQQIGYELPVTELNYWIRGIPAPGEAHDLSFGETSQLLQFQQSGWQINYMGYTNFGTETLPTRIRIQKSPLRLDLYRLDWSLPGDEPLIVTQQDS
ncbi:MAG TPA: outer membrane lipoprotein LolB [Pseudohongiella sp.]|nr:outer membrane lipoprotein LolB [Pseudohongiella sp.]|tara:strand:+ start:823 stop:1452 length:630 start_codon:yes stop_codon:yes gene_type:complete